MEVIFLGTSASIPTKERSLPCIAVKLDKLLVFDMGEGSQREMMIHKIGYGSIDSIFISHAHLDHYLGVIGLSQTYNLLFEKRKFNLYVPKNLKKKLLCMDVANFMLKEIAPGKIWESKLYEVIAFPVEHIKHSFGFVIKEKDKLKFYEKKAKSMGMKGRLFSEIQEKGFVVVKHKKIYLEDITYIKKGKKIVYTGDTKPCKSVLKHAKDCDLLIHESSFSIEQESLARLRNHSTAVDAAKMAKSCKAKTLILTHISPRYKDGRSLLEEAKTIFKNTIIAYDGMRFKL